MRKIVLLLLLAFTDVAFAATKRDDTLPLIINDTTPRGPIMAVLVSGDGGWAAIDKSLAAQLNAAHIPVVGLNSLQYFWRSRTPAETSADLDRIITTFARRWNSSRVVVIGYSRGADVLPFMINRLPRTTADRVALVALLGVSTRVAFEFHVSDWFSDSGKGYEVKPEMEQLTQPTLCFFGTEEKDSACHAVKSPKITGVGLAGDHHFGGRYDLIAKRILQELK